MKGKIRLDGRKNVETKNGFPIIVYLTKSNKLKGKTEEKLIQTGFHSRKTHWDKRNQLPNNKHPEYSALLNYLEPLQIKLRKLLRESIHDKHSLEYVERELNRKDDGTFYSDVMEMYKTKKLSRTYKVAITCFNKYFPNQIYESISKKDAEFLLYKLKETPTKNGRIRTNSGINSYMNTLTAAWNKLGKKDNPFSGVRLPNIRTASKTVSIDDLRKIANKDIKRHFSSRGGSVSEYLDYFMLCFYLGGIDLVDLKNLKKSNIVDGRVEFNRSKGGTNVFVSNRVFPEAQALLNKYNEKEYLVPLHNLNYDGYLGNLSKRYIRMQEKLNLSRKPYSKAPRYTFINRAKELLIDERITKQLVGHSEHSTHSIYKDAFPYAVVDEAHKRIIEF